MATQTILIDLPETGLNLTAQVDAVGGSSFASAVDVAESGSLAGRYSFTLTNSAGQYRIELTDDDDSDSLLAVLYVATTNTTASFSVVDELTLLDVAADAAAAATGEASVQIGGLDPAAIAQLAGTVIRLAPTEQLEAASLDLVQGTDYAADDGTDLRWTVDTPDDLTGATAQLILKRGQSSAEFSGTVTSASGTLWTISVEVAANEIATLTAANDWTYTLNLILASARTRNVRKPGQRARILSAT